MAAITPVTLSLQARDWETIIGLLNNYDEDLQELKFSLQTYYRTQTIKPQGNTLIPIITTEQVVIKLFNTLYSTNVMLVHKDVGANPINRILSVLRASNNVLDNHISTELAAIDANNDNILTGNRKSGRRIILMKNADGL